MARTSKEVIAFYKLPPHPAVLVLVPQQEASTEASLLWRVPSVFTTPLPPAVLSLWLSIWRYNHCRLTSLFFWFIPAAGLEERSISFGTEKLREGGPSQSYSISKSRIIFVNQSLEHFRRSLKAVALLLCLGWVMVQWLLLMPSVIKEMRNYI